MVAPHFPQPNSRGGDQGRRLVRSSLWRFGDFFVTSTRIDKPFRCDRHAAIALIKQNGSETAVVFATRSQMRADPQHSNRTASTRSRVGAAASSR